VGFVGANGQGLGGIEYSLNKVLAGTDGKRTFENGHNGRPIPDGLDVVQNAKPGTGVQLTLDRDIQWQAQQAIAAQVAKTGAKSGTVVVMDPRNGQLLALATAPGFDANQPGKARGDALGNPAVADVYEPGSVNKVITFAAALERGLITPNTPFTVPPTLKYAGRVFHDAEVHGTEHLTATGVLAKSSNIGTIQVADRIGKDSFYSFLRSFGFGSKTGLGVPGESPGLLPPPKQWWGTTLPTIAFGQGVGVTAVQVASVYATIANGGVRVTPTLVAGTVGADGKLDPAARPATRRVVSEKTAKAVSDMLEAVTSDQGTAPAARIPGYRIAGKTGTANRPNGHGGYTGYTASFVGYAPADKPQLVVEAVLQDPKNGHFGGEVAAPVFHDVMTFALQALRIPPTGTKPPVARLTAG
jgi:cell division protein FtsI (penicillin-binding protein 3)